MRKTAFMFPGQGSQTLGMGMAVVRAYNEARDIFTRASDIMGYDMLELCAVGPMEKLSRTVYTQPALFTVEAAITEVLRAAGIKPVCAAGHSLGEFGAWYAAGVFGFEDGLRLVSARGRLMDGADPEGKGIMAAIIGLEYDIVRAACEAAVGTVVVANINSPRQMVISGERDALEQAGEILRGKGAKRILPLKVSGAFHSPLMSAAETSFALEIEKITICDAAFPVYANVTAREVTDAAMIRDSMVRQLTSPVRWTDTVHAMADAGIERAFEIGPGNVLAGLAARTDDRFSVVPVSDPRTIEEGLNDEA